MCVAPTSLRSRGLVQKRSRTNWSRRLKLNIEKWLLVIRPDYRPGWPDSATPTPGRRAQIANPQLGYALDASARNGARLWSKTQPQRLADAKDVGTTPRAAAGAPHTAALRSANLRQVP